MNLLNKTALITGAANGLGQAIAFKLASEGATIILHCNKSTLEGEQTVSKIKEVGGKAYLVTADLSIISGIKSFYEKQIDTVLQSISHHQNLDILINNAGICERTSIQSANEEQFLKMMTVNFLAPTFIIKESLNRFNNNGRIINVSSLMVNKPDNRYLFYGASKAALNNVAKGLVPELGKRGITINTIAPGLIPTNIMKGLNNPLIRDYIIKHTAQQRVGTTGDIAELILLIASEGSQWITGQVIEADGGYK